MKNYLTPKAEIETFETVDVIATSSENTSTTKSNDPYEADKF